MVLTAFAEQLDTDHISLSGHAIECQTTGADLKFQGSMAKVVCPPHCERNLHSAILGASLHPLSSSVCGAALVDGVLSPEVSGELLVTRVPGVPAYAGVDVGKVVSIAAADTHGEAFHVYATDSIDQTQADVRLIDHTGTLSSRGLLEVLTSNGFGTVCGANFDAADVVCKQMGYEHGTLSTSKCGDFLTGNLCGAIGTPVGMKDLKCKGGESSLQDSSCSWEPPDTDCMEHKKDTIISCLDKNIDDVVGEGQLRLVNPDGGPGPIKDGLGRLEIFHDSHWGKVCGDYFTPGNALVACRTMGYEGADVSVHHEGSKDLENVHTTAGGDEAAENPAGGDGASASDKPEEMEEGDETEGADKAVLSDVMCTGKEKSLLDCPHTSGKDATCSSGKAAIVRCHGNGSPNTLGLLTAVPPPAIETASFAPKRTLGCEETPTSLGIDQASPGTSQIFTCPSSCGSSCHLEGQSIYSSDSSICCAARHAGAIGVDGGDVMVTIGHGQKQYFGAEQHFIPSQDAASSVKKPSFVVATPTPEVLSRVAAKARPWFRYAGSSAFGGTVGAVTTPMEKFL